ncbi:hypothetical protein [Halalkalibacter krulwichiae]|uniref:Sporulation lipoprotein YhcN/YlaJ (Spore_YhcN_YlaJ) n=1 Tax=Halalkalibacter krulwichiae TaxID=199441 RepID=A0A1X9MIZ6_9BACI|nr:hypothetical protein [Halalkalibacter krulwichiae]ARK32764.1 hypothetical protein BkAM31D_24495 [Halalkalibacter krulwichiae]
MKKIWLSGLAVGMLLVTGCTDPNPPQAGNQIQAQGERTAYTMGDYGLGMGPLAKTSYNRKHVTTIQESELNRGTSYITPQSSRRTLENDQQLIHHIIEDEHGMKAGMVIIAGSHAFVNVTPPADLNEEDKKKEMGKVKRALLQEVPRYQVHVREDKNN